MFDTLSNAGVSDETINITFWAFQRIAIIDILLVLRLIVISRNCQFLLLLKSLLTNSIHLSWNSTPPTPHQYSVSLSSWCKRTQVLYLSLHALSTVCH